MPSDKIIWPNWLQENWEAKTSLFKPTMAKKIKTEMNNMLEDIPRSFGMADVEEYAEALRYDLQKSAKNRWDRLRYLQKGINTLIPQMKNQFMFDLIDQVHKERKPKSGQTRKVARVYKYENGLPLDSWPEKDRKLWQASISATVKQGLRLAKFAPSIKIAHQSSYGQWIRFRQEQGLSYGEEYLDLVEGFVEKLMQRDISSVTRANIVSRITTVLRDFEKIQKEIIFNIGSYNHQGCNSEDMVTKREKLEDTYTPWSEVKHNQPSMIEYLESYARSLRRQQIPKKAKAPRIVSPIDLYELGKSLCEQAAKSPFKDKAQSIKYRDGLMIMFLAHRPVRLSNLMDIEIKVQGESAFPFGGVLDLENYQISWPASQMKNRNRFEVSLPEIIKSELHTYLRDYRPILKGSNDTKQLWLSREGGRPLSAIEFEMKVKQLTKTHLGVDVPPHYFRDANAHLLVEEEEFWAIPNILNHISEKSSETYKGKAEMRKAQEVSYEINKKVAPHAVL